MNDRFFSRSSSVSTTARIATLFSVIAFFVAAGGHPARAQKKPKPACGIRYLPLIDGNSWSYEPMASPIALTADEKKRLLALEAHAPKPPRKIDIKVVGVVPQEDGSTVITLQETTVHQNDDKVERETTLRCTSKKMEISPQSFFFAGEPGGGLKMELTNLVWDDSFPGRQGFRQARIWLIKVTGDLARDTTKGTGAKLSGGKIEIERKITVALRERLTTASGTYKQAVAVWYQMSGRASVGPNLDKSVEIPLGENGILWFQDGVGMVQVRNRSAQWYQLVDKTLN
jgi:hypothetical protein